MSVLFKPHVDYDDRGHVAYVELRTLPYHHGGDLDPLRAVDYAEDGQVIGLTFIGVGLGKGVRLDDLPVPNPHYIGDLLAENHIPVDWTSLGHSAAQS
jgi:uncharacterized protein YuzE